MAVRHRVIRILLSLSLVASACIGAVAAAGANASSAGAATSGPACTFDGGGTLGIVLNQKPGDKVVIKCTGLAPNHPYLMMETSLLLAVDPAAKPLLTGQVLSLPGLLAVLAALPEINPAALTFPFSDMSGNLNVTYTLPTSNAPDPNATCPPSTAQINAGLIGCAIATIDLTTFKPVAAASSLVEFAGDPLFPPSPTLALSTATATHGQTVTVSDAPGATTFWWLATLTALAALLTGGTPPPSSINVTLSRVHVVVPATVNITPAVYNPPVLTPPKLSGTFTVPKHVTTGVHTVTVAETAKVQIFTLTLTATAPLTVT